MKRKRSILPFALGIAALVFVVVAFGTGTGDSGVPDDDVFLGEVDLAERAEIWRNQYRRMTPGDEPLVQDVGEWPAAWNEFGFHWSVAPATRNLATWLVPFSAERTGNATVIRDATGTVLWSGVTDFVKDESANVTLTGWLVAEEDWSLYEAAREEVELRQSEAFRPVFPGMRGTNGAIMNGLRFTDINVDTNGDYRLSLAWETDGDVQVFCRAMHYECWTNFGVVSTNDENQVVTNDVVNWRQVSGEKFKGIPDAWESLGIATVTNGEGSFTDTNHVDPNFDRVRFYAAAELADTDGDGMTDGEGWLWGLSSPYTDKDNDGLADYDERKLHKTDPDNPDTDGDGLNDGYEVAHGTDPLKEDSDNDGLPDGWEVYNGLDPLIATGANGPDGDPDNDGFSNALELELGAPANNPAWNGEELAWKLVHCTSTVTTSGGITTTNWHGLRVEVEDSADCTECGGTNGSIQDVPETMSVPPLLACGYHVYLIVTGSVEDVDAGYDKVYFEAAETNLLFSSHNGIPDGPEYEEECIMVGESSTANHLILANSDVTLRYDTVGYKWHCGGYAEVISAVVTAPVVADFQEVRERNSPCNRVPNPKQKTPNRLFVATEASGQVELDAVPVIPAEISTQPVLCAVYAGSTHLASASPGSGGIAALSFTPLANIQTNTIRLGIDENHNGVLEPTEFRPTATTVDVVSFTHAHYADRRNDLEDKAWQAAMGPYNVGASLLYRFLNRLTNAPEAFDATYNAFTNCFALSSLTHNAGAVFDSLGNGSLDVYAWNAASMASQKISESVEMEDIVNRLLTNHAGEVTAFFASHPEEDVYFASWTTNNVPIHFSENAKWPYFAEYDLHVSFGHAVIPDLTITISIERENSSDLAIASLAIAGTLVDLYDFDHEEGGLNSEGAVLQIGWDPSFTGRDAGNIFFDRVIFMESFNSWSFDFD